MPPDKAPAWSDERIDQVIGNLLRAGVILATVIVFIGGIVYLMRHGGEHVDYREFRRDPDYSSVSAIFSELAMPRWRAVIQLGILVLLATPVARVVFSVFAFAVQRDWLYVTVTLIVLAVLLYSLFG